MHLALAPQSGLSRWLCRVFLPSSRLTFRRNVVSSENLLRVDSVPSSRSLIRTLKRSGSSTKRRGTQLVTSLQLYLAPFTTTFWAQPPRQFLIQWKVHPSKSWAPASSGEYCGKHCLKPYWSLGRLHPYPFPHPLSMSSYLEGDQVCQVGSTFDKSMLSVSDSPITL